MSAQQHSYLATHIEGRGKICPDIGKSMNNRVQNHMDLHKKPPDE